MQSNSKPSRWFNVIVAASNLYAMRAFSAWLPLDPMCASLCVVAMAASTLYHLVEKHKHSLAGCGSGTLREHKICINMDRAAAVGSTAYILLSYPGIAVQLIPSFVGALLALCLSEMPHLFPQMFEQDIGSNGTRIFYVVIHSAWHVWAFHTLFLAAIIFRNA